MLFTSDNWAGVHPKIMDALVAANSGNMPAYGGDDLTKKVQAQFNELFERECAVFFVTTGGSANGLALSQYVPPFGATFCHEHAHVHMDEVGTPELFSGGAKLLTIRGDDAKITPEALEREAAFYFPSMNHHVKPKALSITQGTEAGTVYSVDEVTALCCAAKKFGLKVHMDGARFSNAVAHLGCSPADITWRAGIDVLSFGATKNGAMVAEAVVFFNPADAEDFAWRQKRVGHVWSKGRFLAAQWQAFFEDDLWLQLASKSNAAATALAQGLREIDGCEVVYPTQINEVFAIFPEGVDQALLEAGAIFYDWIYPGDPWEGRLKRLVTSYVTELEEVERFLDKVREEIKKREEK